MIAHCQHRAQHAFAQAQRTLSVPTEIVIGQVVVVFERHFQCVRQTVKCVANVVACQRHVCIAECVFIVTVYVLEIG